MDSSNDDEWETGFQKLNLYKQQYGTCDIPQHLENSKPFLVRWITIQRCRYQTGSITADQKSRLEALGFSWQRRRQRQQPQQACQETSKNWEKSFQMLIKYRKVH